MKVTHNLSDGELVKAITALAEESGICEELAKAVSRKTAAVDLEPKLPKDTHMRQLYYLMLAEFDMARKDCLHYAEAILK